MLDLRAGRLAALLRAAVGRVELRVVVPRLAVRLALRPAVVLLRAVLLRAAGRAVVRFAAVRVPLLRVPVVRLAAVRVALVRVPVVRLAAVRVALVRAPVVRLAAVRVALVRAPAVRLAVVRAGLLRERVLDAERVVLLRVVVRLAADFAGERLAVDLVAVRLAGARLALVERFAGLLAVVVRLAELRLGAVRVALGVGVRLAPLALCVRVVRLALLRVRLLLLFAGICIS